MSPLDLVALVVLAFTTLRGLARGLVRTALWLAAIAVASLLSWRHPEWGRPVADLISRPSSLVWGFVQPLAVWAGAFVLINGMGMALKAALNKTPLEGVDRLGGAVFGFASGALIVAAPLEFLTQLPLLQQVEPLQRLLHDSLVLTLLTPVFAVLGSVKP